MSKKRFFNLIILSLFFISMFAGAMASPSPDDATDVAREGVGIFAGFLVGVQEAIIDAGIPISRFFMAILLGMVVYAVISSMKLTSKGWINWTISIAITSLALMGIPQELVEVILTQYGVMGATILTIIPFFIVLWFSVRTNSLLAARVTWMFYAMYYLVMYFVKIWNATAWSTPYWLNLGAFIVGLGLFFGIKSVRDFIFKGQMEDFEDDVSRKIKVNVLNQKLANDINKSKVSGEGASQPNI
jgi:hypothetical protein